MFQDGEHQYSPENSNGFLRIFRNCIYSTMMHTEISIPCQPLLAFCKLLFYWIPFYLNACPMANFRPGRDSERQVH